MATTLDTLKTKLTVMLGRTGDTDFATYMNDHFNAAIRAIENTLNPVTGAPVNFRYMKVHPATTSLTANTHTYANPIPRYKKFESLHVIDSAGIRYPVRKKTYREVINAYPDLTNDVGRPRLVAETDQTETLTLSIGTTSDVKVKTPAFSYALNGVTYSAAAAETSLASGTVTADKWAAWRFTVNKPGTVSSTAAAGNVAGYATEALAQAAVPAVPVNTVDLGYITNKTKSGAAFIPGTDSLAGGASGNVASETNYYVSDIAPFFQLIFRPTPDTSYTFDCSGYQYSPELDNVVYKTNWLINNYPDMVLYRTAMEAALLYTERKEDLPVWERAFEKALAGLIEAEGEEVFSGGLLNIGGQVQGNIYDVNSDTNI